MGVNPVTGGDGAVLIKEIKEGRRKARHDSSTSSPPLLFPPLWLRSLQRQQAGVRPACLPAPAHARARGRPGKGLRRGCVNFWISRSAGGSSRQRLRCPQEPAAGCGQLLGVGAARAGGPGTGSCPCCALPRTRRGPDCCRRSFWG